jgi:hypothetical protein
MPTAPTEPEGFEPPPVDASRGETEGLDEEAEVRPSAELDSDQEAEAAFAPPEIPQALLEAKRGIEQGLQERGAEAAAAGALAVDAFHEMGNIQGVALGSVPPAGSATRAVTHEPGTPALTVYTLEPMREDDVRSALVDRIGVRAAAAEDEIPLHVVPTGIIEAAPHRFKLRPAPGGISVGHFKVTAGTLGCLSFGRSAPRNGRVLILSNNHVVANTNNAAIGDCVCQPGTADGGSCPADQVAVLERFVPIVFGGAPNYIDCATAWAWPDRVRKELMYLSSGAPTYFNVNNTPLAAYWGMPVGKTGRTTQLTSGFVSATGASLWVNYGGVSAWFTDQIEITGYTAAFGAGGDSGSLIWTWDAARRPVGLLFATATIGTIPKTFANRIDRVMAGLDIWLWA